MAIIQNPKTIDLSDIQGMVTRGYSKLFETAYIILKVEDAVKAKEWIKAILPSVGSADHTVKYTNTLHLAFGSKGLTALGLNDKNLATFPIPFREGISTPHRNRVLGDHGINKPDQWRWGNENEAEIVLIFHAENKEGMDTFLNAEKARIKTNGGLSIVHEMRGYLPKDNKEPFGFHDGISQPVIEGSGKSGPEHDIIATGEFLLGYKNEFGLYPDSPLLKEDQGQISLLTNDVNGSGLKDLGRNGTFMVFRQMEQHVDKFWKAMEQHTLNQDGTINETAKIRLAAKCVGRWPSGAALVNYPNEDPGGSHENNDFGYADEDPDGLKCPFGSHLRKNNPRDAFRFYDKNKSLKATKRHRIIRRGRTYQNSETNNDKGEIGLQFICFNANLEMQFEFIQHAWANNNQSGKLSNDTDVIIGVQPEENPSNESGKFTIQNEPVNEIYCGWEQFVTIKGGAYLFFPSITFIKFLTTLNK